MGAPASPYPKGIAWEHCLPNCHHAIIRGRFNPSDHDKHSVVGPSRHDWTPGTFLSNGMPFGMGNEHEPTLYMLTLSERHLNNQGSKPSSQR
jgi:hypothetical protein